MNLTLALRESFSDGSFATLRMYGVVVIGESTKSVDRICAGAYPDFIERRRLLCYRMAFHKVVTYSEFNTVD